MCWKSRFLCPEDELKPNQIMFYFEPRGFLRNLNIFWVRRRNLIKGNGVMWRSLNHPTGLRQNSVFVDAIRLAWLTMGEKLPSPPPRLAHSPFPPSTLLVKTKQQMPLSKWLSCLSPSQAWNMLNFSASLPTLPCHWPERCAVRGHCHSGPDNIICMLA